MKFDKEIVVKQRFFFENGNFTARFFLNRIVLTYEKKGMAKKIYQKQLEAGNESISYDEDTNSTIEVIQGTPQSLFALSLHQVHKIMENLIPKHKMSYTIQEVKGGYD